MLVLFGCLYLAVWRWLGFFFFVCSAQSSQVGLGYAIGTLPLLFRRLRLRHLQLPSLLSLRPLTQRSLSVFQMVTTQGVSLVNFRAGALWICILSCLLLNHPASSQTCRGCSGCFYTCDHSYTGIFTVGNPPVPQTRYYARWSSATAITYNPSVPYRSCENCSSGNGCSDRYPMTGHPDCYKPCSNIYAQLASEVRDARQLLFGLLDQSQVVVGGPGFGIDRYVVGELAFNIFKQALDKMVDEDMPPSGTAGGSGLHSYPGWPQAYRVQRLIFTQSRVLNYRSVCGWGPGDNFTTITVNLYFYFVQPRANATLSSQRESAVRTVAQSLANSLLDDPFGIPVARDGHTGYSFIVTLGNFLDPSLLEARQEEECSLCSIFAAREPELELFRDLLHPDLGGRFDMFEYAPKLRGWLDLVSDLLSPPPLVNCPSLGGDVVIFTHIPNERSFGDPNQYGLSEAFASTGNLMREYFFDVHSLPILYAAVPSFGEDTGLRSLASLNLCSTGIYYLSVVGRMFTFVIFTIWFAFAIKKLLFKAFN